ncbi:O-antigen ligase family protein [Propionibacteriaceae bacterium Y2011]
MRRIDVLLVAALVLSPMTGLRFGKIGPAEVLAAAWCVLACLNARHPLVPGTLGKAWVVFFGILVAGTLHGVVVTPGSTTPTGLVTWAYLGIICVLGYSVLQGRTADQLNRLLAAIGGATTVWFAGLYVYSITISTTFLGSRLWYGQRFAGGGDNPHQLAVMLSASIFINFRALLLARTARQRAWWLLITAVTLVLGYLTASATLLLAVGVVAALALFFLALDRIGSRSGRVAFTTAVLMAAVVGVALLWDRVLGLAERFLDSDSNGWGRLTLWLDFNDVLDHVVLLGLGPGTYADGGDFEFHNSYLELAAMLGIPAALGLFVMLALTIRRLLRHWTLMTIVMVLLVYALPGFAIRRLSFWLIFALCLALAVALDRRDIAAADPASPRRATPTAPSPAHTRTVAGTGGEPGRGLSPRAARGTRPLSSPPLR